MEPIYRFSRYLYYRFIRLRAEPEEMARGMAIGVFVGFTPTLGLQTVIAIFIAALFRGNKILAGAAACVTNPATIPFIYAGTYKLGAMILQTPQKDIDFLVHPSLESLLESGNGIFAAMWIGGILVGLILAPITYFVSLKLEYAALRKIARARVHSKNKKNRSGKEGLMKPEPAENRAD